MLLRDTKMFVGKSLSKGLYFGLTYNITRFQNVRTSSFDARYSVMDTTIRFCLVSPLVAHRQAKI